jgi:hypothetical protein
MPVKRLGLARVLKTGDADGLRGSTASSVERKERAPQTPMIRPTSILTREGDTMFARPLAHKAACVAMLAVGATAAATDAPDAWASCRGATTPCYEWRCTGDGWQAVRAQPKGTACSQTNGQPGACNGAGVCGPLPPQVSGQADPTW